jgi:DNA adenine methylase
MPAAAQTPGEAATGVRPVRPFLKWAGGKGQLLAAFERYYPRREDVRGYLEPFLGSGAVFLHVQALLAPKRVVLTDSNAELINAFEAVKERVEDLIDLLADHKRRHDKDPERYFYKVRDEAPPHPLSETERAARLIYLNKTCFNGLYRVNSKGRFNVPFGRYKNPTLCDPEALREASARLKGVKLGTGHFSRVLKVAKPGDFVYFDPPYHPLSGTAYFTSYTEGSFGEADQRELAAVFTALSARGCKVMLSNSDTEFIRDLYKEFAEFQFSELARRNINSRGDRRGQISELVVTNYPPREARRLSAKSAKPANRAADSPG